MHDSLHKVRGAFVDLLNAIDDARGTSATTDAGDEALTAFEERIETLIHEFDHGFDESERYNQ